MMIATHEIEVRASKAVEIHFHGDEQIVTTERNRTTRTTSITVRWVIEKQRDGTLWWTWNIYNLKRRYHVVKKDGTVGVEQAGSWWPKPDIEASLHDIIEPTRPTQVVTVRERSDA